MPATTGTPRTVESLASGEEELVGVMQADKGREETRPGQCTDVTEECKAARLLRVVQGERDSAFNLPSQVNRGFISAQIIQAEALPSLPQVPLPHTCTVGRLTALMESQTGNYNQRQFIHI